jgi:hypothetical protein
MGVWKARYPLPPQNISKNSKFYEEGIYQIGIQIEKKLNFI